jgi:hypothetical protein
MGQRDFLRCMPAPQCAEDLLLRAARWLAALVYSCYPRAPPTFLPGGGGSSSGEGGGRIHGTGELSLFLGSDVVLEASGVQRRL